MVYQQNQHAEFKSKSGIFRKRFGVLPYACRRGYTTLLHAHQSSRVEVRGVRSRGLYTIHDVCVHDMSSSLYDLLLWPRFIVAGVLVCLGNLLESRISCALCNSSKPYPKTTASDLFACKLAYTRMIIATVAHGIVLEVERVEGGQSLFAQSQAGNTRVGSTLFQKFVQLLQTQLTPHLALPLNAHNSAE